MIGLVQGDRHHHRATQHLGHGFNLSNGLAPRCPETSGSEAWVVLPNVFSAGTLLRICLRHRYAERLEPLRLAKPPASSRVGVQVNQQVQFVPYQSLYVSHTSSNLGRPRLQSSSIGPSQSHSCRECVMSRDDQSEMCSISGWMTRASHGHSQDSDGNKRRSKTVSLLSQARLGPGP